MELEQLIQEQLKQLRTDVEKLKHFKVRVETQENTKEYLIRKWMREVPKIISWIIIGAFIVYELKKMDPHL